MPAADFLACVALADYAASRGRQSWVVVDEGPEAVPRYVVMAANMLDGERVVYFAAAIQRRRSWKR